VPSGPETGVCTVCSAIRDSEAAYALLLLDAPAVGPRRALALLQKCGSAGAAIEYVRAGNGVPERVKFFVRDTPLESYTESIARTRELNGDYKLWSDPDYPHSLTLWEGRPPVLFYKGDLSNLGGKTLALVGRVDPTDEGSAAAERFARKCVQAGIAVISGLAKGIDGIAHRAALAPPEGSTYAVLGHGIDYTYPKDNYDLYQSIPAHGAVISQFKTGMGPQKWTFPARNEVMCTLALGTVIVEGKPGCGSIIQADFSFKHGRPVFLLGRNLKTGETGWARELVKRGAHVVEKFAQVLEVVEDTIGKRRREAEVEHEALFEADSRSAGGPVFSRGGASSVAALFDIDGVVVDTKAATATALASLASRYLDRSVNSAEVNILISPYKALAELGVPQAWKVYNTGYDSAFSAACEAVRPFSEVVAAVKALRRSGVRVAAVTAQPERRVELLLPGELDGLFEFVFSSRHTGGKKEMGISKALARLGVSTAHALYVGDLPKDLKAARTAGVMAVGVLWGYGTEMELQRCPHDLLVREEGRLLADVRRLLAQGC